MSGKRLSGLGEGSDSVENRHPLKIPSPSKDKMNCWFCGKPNAIKEVRGLWECKNAKCIKKAHKKVVKIVKEKLQVAK